MTRVQKTVLWTLAVCVFGYIAVHVMIVKAPGVTQAQQPATDPAGSIPLPEDQPVGLGEERAAPAPAAQPARALVAVCVDRGLALDNVIVDVLRETPGESVFDPRVESFGRTKTKDDGKFSVTLPPIRGKTEESGAAAKYILYFTAPGRPVKSLVIDNDTELPKEIVIPTESTEDVYLPMHHLVVVKPEGISVSPMLSAIRGFSKDGQPIRVSQLVDHRNEGKTLRSKFGSSLRGPPRDPMSLRNQLGMGPPRQQSPQEQIRAARKRLTDAKTDEDKQAARAQLRKLLSDIFAQDMREREQTAAEIESRLAALRRQYQAREQVKDEIINLQLKVIDQRIPALATSAGVSVREILAFKPEGAAIDYDQPSEAEIAACRVVLEPGEAWTLLDRDLVLLRRFVDKNHDGIVDLWAYYKSGKEVWRDVDTNFDGKADHHEGVDSGRK